ncbi:hypothetical protein DFH28DRAFT_609243 [Melampsora americana]|nr:hypothetical protein DFH28DRAFT_609243 [Melampsora americana]
MRHAVDMPPVYPDLRRPSASGQLTEMTDYYSPAMTPVNGYHHASVEHPSMAMGYSKPQSQAPTSRTLEPAHSFHKHDLHLHKPPSPASISPDAVSPEGHDEVVFEGGYNSYPHNQESISSSSCSSPELEHQAGEAPLYLKNDPEGGKEEFHTYSPVEEGPDRAMYYELAPDHVEESYQASHYNQGAPNVHTPTENQEKYIDRALVPSEVTPRGVGKKSPSVKVSEKRRQQNRAAQRAMRERRKRAAQHQEVHMAAILSENAYLRERVNYLSNLLLTHTTIHPDHIQQWDPYAHKTPQSFTPISTTNQSNPSSVAESPPQEASGALPSIYTAHGPVPYSLPTNHEGVSNPYPPAHYQTVHSSSNVRHMSGASSSSEFLRPKIPGASARVGKPYEHPGWDRFDMGDVNPPERSFGLARTMECSSIATSTVPSPTETDEYSIEHLPRVGC